LLPLPDHPPTIEGARKWSTPLVTVDDDPRVARDLLRRYGSDYRAVRAELGPQVLEALREMKLAKAADPASAARLTTAQVSAALKHSRRRDITTKTAAIRAALRAEQLAQPPVVTAACAAAVRALTAVITALNTQIKVMEGQVEAHFLPHPDALDHHVPARPGTHPRRPGARRVRP
jgi:hypothetical protein